MNIRIPVTLSPHIVKGKPRGYYLLAQRLFPNGAPILRKDQFVGFSGGFMVITVARQNTWNTLMHMAIYASDVYGEIFAWLDSCKLYPMNKGFRAYIPGTILRPPSAGSKKVETFGLFQKTAFGGDVADMWYVKVPDVSAEVLLGSKRL